MEKMGRLILSSLLPGKKRQEILLTAFSLVLCAVIAAMLILTVYGYAFPFYDALPASS